MRKYIEWKDEIDVEAVAEALGIEETEGRTTEEKWTGFCPFPDNHTNGDRTGKFAIYHESKQSHCWGCGTREILVLVMELLDLDQDQAENWLYEYATGDTRTNQEFVEDFLNKFRPTERRRSKLPEFGPSILQKRFLPIVDAYPEFLEERGISEEVAVRYSLMYAPEYRSVRYVNDEPEEYVGPFVIFPHHFGGKLVGWQARVVNEAPPKGPPSYPGWVPKYKMTSEFPKDTTLYGFDQAKTMQGPVIVTEGGAGVLFAASQGIPAVGTFGAEPTRKQIKILSGYAEVILAQDNDKAGKRFVDTLETALDNVLGILAPPNISQHSDLGDYEPQALLERYREALGSLFRWDDLLGNP